MCAVKHVNVDIPSFIKVHRTQYGKGSTEWVSYLNKKHNYDKLTFRKKIGQTLS